MSHGSFARFSCTRGMAPRPDRVACGSVKDRKPCRLSRGQIGASARATAARRRPHRCACRKFEHYLRTGNLRTRPRAAGGPAVARRVNHTETHSATSPSSESSDASRTREPEVRKGVAGTESIALREQPPMAYV